MVKKTLILLILLVSCSGSLIVVDETPKSLNSEDVLNLIFDSYKNFSSNPEKAVDTIWGFAHENNNKLIGFTNWGLLSDKAHNKFKQTGFIDNKDWNSGNNLWHIETICKYNLKNIMKWTKSFLTKQIGIGKEINWIRIKSNVDKIKLD